MSSLEIAISLLSVSSWVCRVRGTLQKSTLTPSPFHPRVFGTEYPQVLLCGYLAWKYIPMLGTQGN